MATEQERILAKTKTGLDVGRVRRRKTLTAVGLAVGAGAVIAFIANRVRAARNEASGPLTAAGLRAQGYSEDQIDRILGVQPYVEQWSLAYGVDPALVYAIIRCESNFQPQVVSGAGAAGLMQIMPGTEDFWSGKLGVSGNIFEPAYNIQLGTFGLSRLFNRWGHNLTRVLASYNWGLGNVQEHPDGPYPQETQNYISCVLKHQQRFRSAMSGAAVA